MSTKFVCDGCNKIGDIGEKMHERGLVKKSHYCDTCVTVVDEFETARKLAQVEAAKQFQESLSKHVETFKAKLDTGILPDER